MKFELESFAFCVAAAVGITVTVAFFAVILAPLFTQ